MDLLSGIASWVVGVFGMGGDTNGGQRASTNANWGQRASTNANWGQRASTNSNRGQRASINAKYRIPIYDLHGVHAGEVKKGEERFLQKNRNASHVKIITGRGLHSKDGRPVNKIITEKYLNDNGYKYSVKDKGGSVIVNTKKAKS